MKTAKDNGWNPYLAGSLTGLLIIITAWLSGTYFGASTSFVRTAGMIEKLVSPDRVASMDYFMRFAPIIDRQWMLVIGIFLGSFISSVTSGSFRVQAVPDMWEKQFGTGCLKRTVVALIGGAVLMFGARLAGGCPSGHGMGGSPQLAVSGFISLICFFIGGIVVARIIYRRNKK